MKSGRPCPKCGATAIELFESVRAGGGPLAVGHVSAGAFAMFSQFEAFVCRNCGYTEFYRK
jgi:predicted nucleic-acid-binding Zn-ribbon protein